MGALGRMPEAPHSISTRSDVSRSELDAVVGDSWQRLPSFSDRSSLPYIEAIVLEILRWNPAVPLGPSVSHDTNHPSYTIIIHFIGLAHSLTQDDIYHGYHFAKGTTLWANIWCAEQNRFPHDLHVLKRLRRSMLHDEKVFLEPSKFMPERYLNDNGALRELPRLEDPSIIGFGFGRRCAQFVTERPFPPFSQNCRICPGMYFAHNSIFISIARMLYVFDFSKARDQDGNEVTPDIQYDGFIRYVRSHSAISTSFSTPQSCSHPRPFPCSISPRSKAAEDLLSLQTE